MCANRFRFRPGAASLTCASGLASCDASLPNSGPKKKLSGPLRPWEKPPARRRSGSKASRSFAHSAQDFGGGLRRPPKRLNLPVTIPRGSHPFPSRTRKLSLAGPMVLHAKVCGRLGDRRHIHAKSPLFGAGFFVLGGSPAASAPGTVKISASPAMRRRCQFAPYTK